MGRRSTTDPGCGHRLCARRVIALPQRERRGPMSPSDRLLVAHDRQNGRTVLASQVAHMALFCSICGWFGGGRRVLHPVRFWVSRCLKAQNHGEQNRVQNNRVWQRACGLTATVVEGIRFDEAADAIVVSARLNARARSRCGRCGRRSPGYDRGAGRPRWRVLDADTEAETDPRIQQESAICAHFAVPSRWGMTLL